MPITRATVLQGPCQIQYSGSNFYSKGDVKLVLNGAYGKIVSDAIGVIDYRDDDWTADITFQPDGQTTDTLIGILFPISTDASLYPGASVFPESDTPLTIWTRDGWKHVFNNAAVTKEPGFSATPTKTLFSGSVTFTSLRTNGDDWSATNSLIANSADAYPGDTDFNSANIITTKFGLRWLTGTTPTGSFAVTQASPAVFTADAHGLVAKDTVVISGATVDTALNGTFTVAPTDLTDNTFTLYALGTTTPVNNTVGADTGTFTRADWFDGFTTEAGFEISTALSLSKVGTDDEGVIDYRFQSLEVTASAVPIGPNPGQIMAALGFQGSGAGRGTSRGGRGQNLYLSGTGIYAKLPNAFLTDSEAVIASPTKKRIGKTTWKSLVSNTSGTQGAALVLSTSSIS